MLYSFRWKKVIMFYIVLALITGVKIQTSAADCDASNGIYKFGQNCEYMCHCKALESCDADTGNCGSGCDRNWFGPGCQFRNLGGLLESRHLDNIDPGLWSYLARDGNLQSCSVTNNATASRTVSPWWRTWFKHNETIWSMEFVTQGYALQYFRDFNVSVEYIPPTIEYKDSSYYPAGPQLCYKHSNRVPSSTTIQVTCDRPLQGNQVRIQLANTDTQLVLCEVRINGGRNVAFMKSVLYSSIQNETNYPSSNLVDGDTQFDSWRQCFATKQSEQERLDWLAIDLGHVYFISFINLTLFYNSELVKDYQLLVSNASGDTNTVLVHDDAGNSPPTSDIAVDITGQYVNFTRRSRPTESTVVCEMEVFADCPQGSCGLDCSIDCHCKSIEDRVSGDCKSGCEGRWTGNDSHCLTECSDVEWGVSCENPCGKCQNSQPCDVETGYCPSGCADGYIATDLCDTECPDGSYGDNCTLPCSENCLDGMACRKTDGHCAEGCEPGYTGNICDAVCVDGMYGISCTQSCSGNCEGGNSNCHHENGTCLQGCTAGFEGAKCEKECDDGFWDNNCNKTCGSCLNGTCDPSKGRCDGGCAAGFQHTSRCNKGCPDYTFGINCTANCSWNCKDKCNKVNGSCTCKTGWEGILCEQPCSDGEWGENCLETCGKCSNGTCDRVSGKCHGGCLPGYNTTAMCDQECTQGSYGEGCSGFCSASCKVPNVCNHVDGNCGGCMTGKRGDRCDTDCEDGYHGEDCLLPCGACRGNETCDRETGYCSKGCSRGYKHSSICSAECEDGTYGDNCTETCGNCKKGTTCDKVTGECLGGCDKGFKPDVCKEALPQTEGVAIGGIVGGIVAAVVVIVVVLFVLIYLRRRRQCLRKKTEGDTKSDDMIIHEPMQKRKDQNRENVYANSVDAETEYDSPQEIPYINTQYQTTEFQTPPEVDNSNVYYNSGHVARRRMEHTVFVTDLEEYVKKKFTDKTGFTAEFAKLPVGLQHPTTEAKKAGNIGKNRYKVLYTYDHSRVFLDTLPGLPNSGYINASFIKGYSKDNAYIASQGPTKFNTDEFWRMIWEKNVFTIVMATRVVEDSRMKCLKYWADEGDSVQYGRISIRTESENVLAEFVIRRLTISHEDEPGSARHIKQFQYTAWSDKVVPRGTSGLLYFWYQVRKNDPEKSHPWLVHCSAGVGRTGTFIAMDVLYDQGIDQGCIDVFQYVKDLRDHRANMVQTKQQYSYLHRLLVEALVLPWKPIPTDEFSTVFNGLQDIDPKTGKVKLMMEYERLLDEIDSDSESNEIGEMYTSDMHTQSMSKIIYDNILAPNDYRPHLSTYVKGYTDYINAVYIPSYRDVHGYILTQSPFPDTAIDCCRLVFEHEVSVIVAFEESSDEEVGVYLPNTGSVDVGAFTVTTDSELEKECCIIKSHRLIFNSKEHKFTQIVCKQWLSNHATPSDPNKVLVFLQELECLQRGASNKPVMVQCLNGTERSGLIVTLMNILQRARLDNEVSIPQVIRQLRTRREQIIPDFDQYKFCYDVLHSYVESSAAYSNV